MPCTSYIGPWLELVLRNSLARWPDLHSHWLCIGLKKSLDDYSSSTSLCILAYSLNLRARPTTKRAEAILPEEEGALHGKRAIFSWSNDAMCE